MNGNEIICDDFGYTIDYKNGNQKKIYTYNDVEITEELYNKLIKRYFEIGTDKIEWITLYKNYYDGKNHFDDEYYEKG